MLDKLITYIVCWCKTLYQFLPVAWTNCITPRRYRDSQWYWFTQQGRLNLVPTHYVCNGYLSCVKVKCKIYKSSINNKPCTYCLLPRYLGFFHPFPSSVDFSSWMTWSSVETGAGDSQDLPHAEMRCCKRDVIQGMR